MIVDLQQEREIKALIDQLGKVISATPETINRTFDYLASDLAMVDTVKTKTVSIRFPKELLEWIDRYSRIKSLNDDTRITRNNIVINFLETMKAIIEYREKTEWGRSHVEEIEAVLNEARKQQS